MSAYDADAVSYRAEARCIGVANLCLRIDSDRIQQDGMRAREMVEKARD